MIFMEPTLEQAVADYRGARSTLHRIVEEAFPVGSVASSRDGKVWGIVQRIAEGAPDTVQMTHGRGNTCYVSVSILEPQPNPETWPQWLRDWFAGEDE